MSDQREKRKDKRPLITDGSFTDLVKRKISEETCRHFGYKTGSLDGKSIQIAPYHDSDGKLVAQKIRFPSKDFTVTGDLSSAGLFGQHLWRNGGKRLVITEGEIDALSYAQVTNCSWPVVSVPNGASGAKKAIQKQLEWIEQFDQVVFLFDMDEPGQKAAKECAELLTPGKAAIGSMPMKDASDMLVAGRVKELQVAVWEAKTRRPDGVVNANELWDQVSKTVEMGTPYPWETMNRFLYGLRGREIVTLCAGSGIGKSSVSAEVAFHLAQVIKDNVGYVALEEGLDRTGLRFMGMHVNKPLHLPGNDMSPEDRKAAFEATIGSGRYWFYDHFGSLDSDNLMLKLRYLVKGCGCKWLVLDHLSIIVSGLDPDEDERRAIDRTMTRLRQFTEETGVGLILVSHLKRPEGKGHEDGAATSLAQLRGSAAIAQLSDIVIGLERNQQSDDSLARDVTILRVLKNRYAGTTGVAAALRYDRDTGRLTEVEFDIGENGKVIVGSCPADDDVPWDTESTDDSEF